MRLCNGWHILVVQRRRESNPSGLQNRTALHRTRAMGFGGVLCNEQIPYPSGPLHRSQDRVRFAVVRFSSSVVSRTTVVLSPWTRTHWLKPDFPSTGFAVEHPVAIREMTASVKSMNLIDDLFRKWKARCLPTPGIVPYMDGGVNPVSSLMSGTSFRI